MTQRTSTTPDHIAIIMDGNGRWAGQRRLPRSVGHRVGVRRVREVVEAAAERGVPMLTLYALSSANFARPAAEVAALLGLLERYLMEEAVAARGRGVRLSVVGSRHRLSAGLRSAIERAECVTAEGRGLHVRLAIDYSSRAALAGAARCAAREASVAGDVARIDAGAFPRLLAAAQNAAEPVPDVDLLIRTGGERRLSDFLLWESAYAELYFTDVLWPDFDAGGLDDALADYARRERRFGGLGRPATALREVAS
ncbi:MAG: polyprenyl diphosphate synthase [Longimicrobiales bacterium]